RLRCGDGGGALTLQPFFDRLDNLAQPVQVIIPDDERRGAVHLRLQVQLQKRRFARLTGDHPASAVDAYLAARLIPGNGPGVRALLLAYVDAEGPVTARPRLRLAGHAAAAPAALGLDPPQVGQEVPVVLVIGDGGPDVVAAVW